MTLQEADGAIASILAFDLFGLTVTASALPSERDQNFLLVSAADERYVLKISNLREDRGFLEAQNAAMQHLAPLHLCPRVVRTAAGQDIIESHGHFVRLLTWLPGRPLAVLASKSDVLLEDLGARTGE